MTGALADRIDANERFAADVSHEIKNPLASIQSAVESARAATAIRSSRRKCSPSSPRTCSGSTAWSPTSPAPAASKRKPRAAISTASISAQLLFELTRAYAAPPDEARRRSRSCSMAAEPDGAIVLGSGRAARPSVPQSDRQRPLVQPRRREGHGVSADGRASKDGAVCARDGRGQGPGIPPENLETVFERFYTQRPKGAAFGGNSGLGLSIARQIVTAHGGRIYAQNRRRPGRGERGGARLVVELPLAREPEREANCNRSAAFRFSRNCEKLLCAALRPGPHWRVGGSTE